MLGEMGTAGCAGDCWSFLRLGGLNSGVLVFTLAPEAGRARDRRRDRSLPSPPRADSPSRAFSQDGCQRRDSGDRRLRGLAQAPLRKSGPVLVLSWPKTCCDCVRPNVASSWPPAWEPGLAAIFRAPRRGPCSRPKSSTAPPNLNPRSSFRREWPASFPMAFLRQKTVFEAAVYHSRYLYVYQPVAVGAVPALGFGVLFGGVGECGLFILRFKAP